MKKFTKKQKEVLDGFWKDVMVARKTYFENILFVEAQLHHHLGIDIEVFHVDGDPVGFGDYLREYKLWEVEYEVEKYEDS